MRPRFTIRLLLVATAIVACLCGWIGFQRRQAQSRKQAIARLEELSGPISYYLEGYVHGINLEGHVLDKSLWNHVAVLNKEVRSVWLSETNVTDAELRYLRSFRRIEHLSLYNTRVTSEGIEAISNLTSLKTLIISNSLVDDRAVPSLVKLNGLTGLNVRGTRISAAGIAQLCSALPTCRIYYSGEQGDPREWPIAAESDG